uniref:Photolyase/cryptochrome alpha/beta domain-containing protein n=1 Tax=Zea mays TaxID=4577 RepID=A0A804LK23_MAIZE
MVGGGPKILHHLPPPSSESTHPHLSSPGISLLIRSSTPPNPYLLSPHPFIRPSHLPWPPPPALTPVPSRATTPASSPSRPSRSASPSARRPPPHSPPSPPPSTSPLKSLHSPSASTPPPRSPPPAAPPASIPPPPPSSPRCPPQRPASPAPSLRARPPQQGAAARSSGSAPTSASTTMSRFTPQRGRRPPSSPFSSSIRGTSASPPRGSTGRARTAPTSCSIRSPTCAVYAHGEVSRDEVRAEERVQKAVEKEGINVKYFWGSTLYHVEDLPFRLEDMPSNYGGFREAVKGLEVRKVLEAPEEVKCVPMKNVLEPGDIPTLAELGLTAPPAMSQDSKPAVGSTLIGGETEALERLPLSTVHV